MDSWHATFLGLRHLPCGVTGFEVEVFFQYSAEEARIIEERRRPELKLGLALPIGFLRMSGRLLDAVRMVPPLLWRHLGERFGVAAPDFASLRAMYQRAPTLIEHQQLACDALGFQWLTGRHRRVLGGVLRQELSRSYGRERLLGFARRWLYEHQAPNRPRAASRWFNQCRWIGSLRPRIGSVIDRERDCAIDWGSCDIAWSDHQACALRLPPMKWAFDIWIRVGFMGSE